MQRTILPILAVLALSLSPGAAAPSPPSTPLRGLDSDVPRTFWGYEMFAQFENRGLFFGFPDRIGNAAYTRREFAQRTAVLMTTFESLAGVGSPLLDSDRRRWRGVDPATRLLRRFDQEMWQIGIDPEWGHSTAERIAEFWRTGRPSGVTVPFAPWPSEKTSYVNATATLYNAGLRALGARFASDAWARGDRRLLTIQPLPALKLALPTAVQWQMVPADMKLVQREQFARGHNEVMWRLLREQGVADPKVRGWLAMVLNPRRAWKEGRKQRVQLDAKHPSVEVPEFNVRLTRNSPKDMGRLLTLRDPEGKTLEQGDPFAPTSADPLELVWGPPRSGIYVARTRVKNDREMPHRIYVIDLGSGAVLNAVAAP